MSGIRRGFLSDYFDGIAVKTLSLVEADPESSNQHEFNGTRALRRMLGDEEPREFPARFIWLGEAQEGITDEGNVSWYDSRRNQKHRAAEYRLYYPTNAVSKVMNAGDTLFIARRPDSSLLLVVTPADSTIQNQLMWLFGLEEQPRLDFVSRPITKDDDEELDFAARYILDELGVELEEPEADRLDALLKPFGLTLPSTREFSEFARSTITEVSPVDEPDAALLSWMEREEQLFKRLERRIVAERLSSGFMSGDEADVEGFLSFSLTVQNRRKSRAGSALEHHLEALFKAQQLRFVRGAETENRNRPDFLFPGITEYRDDGFPASQLTMLGAKSTAKERWQQVLAEAARIKEKHLLTLEPGISSNQTEKMQASNLRLVVPARLHETYQENQRAWLMDVVEFVGLVRKRQESKH